MRQDRCCSSRRLLPREIQRGIHSRRRVLQRPPRVQACPPLLLPVSPSGPCAPPHCDDAATAADRVRLLCGCRVRSHSTCWGRSESAQSSTHRESRSQGGVSVGRVSSPTPTRTAMSPGRGAPSLIPQGAPSVRGRVRSAAAVADKHGEGQTRQTTEERDRGIAKNTANALHTASLLLAAPAEREVSCTRWRPCANYLAFCASASSDPTMIIRLPHDHWHRTSAWPDICAMASHEKAPHTTNQTT